METVIKLLTVLEIGLSTAATIRRLVICLAILFVIVVVIALVITEKKRRALQKAKAQKRRQSRQAALAKARNEWQNSFKDEVSHETGLYHREDEETEEEMEEAFEDEPVAEPADEPVEEPLYEDDGEDIKLSSLEDEFEERDSLIDTVAAQVQFDEEEEQEPFKKQETAKWVALIFGLLAVIVILILLIWKPAGDEETPGIENVDISNASGQVDDSDASASGGSEESGKQNEENSGIGNGSNTVGQIAQTGIELEMTSGFMTEPKAIAETTASAMGVSWNIYTSENGYVTSYQRANPISFGGPSRYFSLPGIPTFRGNNYRTGGSYGTVSMTARTFSEPIWINYTDALETSEGGYWTGNGWTGQPLIVQWDNETRQIMNLYSEKKAKEGLVEVVYASLDGYIYFIDLEDGEYTRDPLYLGMTFKGAGALDPRGYPLMYVGSGDYTAGGTAPHMYIISLIDGSVLFEYGNNDPAAERDWCAFDSSPLVDAETDTLIWPGESGVLYTVRLNTVYDKAAGSISISPDIVARTTYITSKYSGYSYWLGYECSAVIMDHYIYLSENGGMFYCVDLNTMELVWAQDTKDDSNSSPEAEYNVKTGEGYLYTAPSLHWTADDGWGSINIYKLNALTGEIVWQHEYECGTVDGVSGGVQASPVLGKAGSNIEDLVIYPVARTPGMWSGILVALNKETGEEAWRLDMDNYTWSSPVAVYTEDNKGYLVLFDSGGLGFLIDGATGEVIDETSVQYLVEATPAIYENTIVVGTRGQEIYALKLQ